MKSKALKISDHTIKMKLGLLLEQQLPNTSISGLLTDINARIAIAGEAEAMALELCKNYVLAQKSIVLGLEADIAKPGLYNECGIPWPLFSTKSLCEDASSAQQWGYVLAEHIKYVKDNGGKITFLLPTNFSIDKAVKAIKLFNAIKNEGFISKIEIQGKSSFDNAIYLEFLRFFDKDFNTAYASSTRPGDIISNKAGGAITYFELAYLIANEIDFEVKTTSETQKADFGRLAPKNIRHFKFVK